MLPDERTDCQLQPLSLAEFTSVSPPSSLNTPHGVYRARILSVRPWSPHTRLGQIQLGAVPGDEPETAVVVELKGLWADRATRRFRKGDVVILLTKGAELIETKGKKRSDASEQDPAVKLRYSRGLTGWIRRKDRSEEVLRYEGACNFDASERSSLNLLPIDATTKSAPRVPAKRLQPEGMDVDLPLRSAVSAPTVTVPPSKTSRPNEGARSKKRQRREERLGWGFETVSHPHSLRCRLPLIRY